MAATELTRTHRILIGVVVAGAVVIAAIGFAGSYSAVRDLAREKGFGAFANVFPIGIDAGIIVLLALDLLLTWFRIPFPLLRQTAWLLTAATIAFNGAAAWPDPLGVGMHAVIPVLFVVSVEAARHAIGRIADITADKHMEGVRLSRWLLAFPSTFRLWRRMKLWELRSYDEVIKLEQDRLVYRARLRARYGRAWRRKAPVESLMPLKLAKYGVSLAETGAVGLAAAGITVQTPQALQASLQATQAAQAAQTPQAALTSQTSQSPQASDTQHPPQIEAVSADPAAANPGSANPQEAHPQEARPAISSGRHSTPTAGAEGAQPARTAAPAASYASEHEAAPRLTVPVGPGRHRPLGNSQLNTPGTGAFVPQQRSTASDLPQEQPPAAGPEAEFDLDSELDTTRLPENTSAAEVYFGAFRQYCAQHGDFPDARQLSRFLHDQFGLTNPKGQLLSESYLRKFMREFRDRHRMEMGTEQAP
ncbi:DUF2637 domain-containing protein [Streptomyces sp. H27-D2]|uniref:DUF2637 domain-containing protein n=1 Tax=Streptomyces sp. H27-D2 TaxID=3046304 RepID=UPI002DBA262F|nr:DUF2637 domain-containing protein [Streptomyces sp. H27-D2]MEC4016992.1 DUF2637 domain-containing protein [Streptomyces sp. H27-D2]